MNIYRIGDILDPKEVGNKAAFLSLLKSEGFHVPGGIVLGAQVFRAAVLENENKKEADTLSSSIRKHLWDEKCGMYYSADISILPIDTNEFLHSGKPRHWESLIMRIDSWSGFLAMWAGIATPEEAERMVRENMLNERTFWSNYGIRSLSKCEKMYKVWQSGNPSCWIGPIWGNANYMCWKALPGEN